MCFRVVSKVGGVLGLSPVLLAGICMFFPAAEIQAQNASSGSGGSPSAFRTLAGHVPPASAHFSAVGGAAGDQRLSLAISLPLR